MASPSKKRLALAIIDFLQTSLKDGTLNAEDAESIEIAQNCIAEGFKVDPNDKAAMSDALSGQSLLSIYNVYEKLKGKSASGASGSSEAAAAAATTTGQADGQSGGQAQASDEAKAEAEKMKGQGNAAMQRKDYDAAIDLYTKALELVPLNPIYLSNRAAAFSAAQKHELAKNDAEMAVAADPKYSKAWSRLGLAKFALGDAKGSMDAYKQGIDAEGDAASEAMKRGYETAKKRVEEEGGTVNDTDSTTQSKDASSAAAGGGPDLAGLASMLGGGGGGGGGGGMPDLSQMMQNPMLRQMAQNVMSNPDMLNNIMNNPGLRDMAQRFGGGGGGGGSGAAGGGGGAGGMPDIASLMQDPNLAEMAKNMMGGAGRGGGS